jgi:outer membrane protein OmpA-like peptidoglycan-associated protein
VEHFGGSTLNSKHHEGPAVFSADGQRVFFTSNNAISQSVKEDRARTVRLKIFTAERKAKGSDWERPEELDFNSGDFSNAAPALSADGTVLVFSSTRPGGFGGADLYMSRWENEAWTRPVNLGSGVNTEGEEVFPFLHQDGTLYFASDGHAGLGGLDLFAAEADYSEHREGLVSSRMWMLDPADSIRFQLGSWLPARNMGWALNSPWDDFGLIWDAERENGYFASNRPGGIGNDDIYFMRHNWVCIEGLVYDSITGDPLPYARVRIEGAPAEKWVQTNDIGAFAIDLPKESPLVFEGFADGYAPNTVSALARHGAPNRVEVPLLDAGIPVQVRVVHAVTGEPLPGTALTMDNPCTGFASDFTADDEGKVRLQLSRTCDYTWMGKKEGFAEGVLPISLMTVELSNIYYDYDEAFIREDGVADLIALAEFMHQNPELTIEIGSHTDARGSDRYNNKLSQRRADAAVDFLIQLGVDPDRLSAMGYGEICVRNHCVNGVNCTDEEHQYNRRTEFTVTGLDFNLYSTDKDEIPVNTGRRAR